MHYIVIDGIVAKSPKRCGLESRIRHFTIAEVVTEIV